ncbi:hypothetical protein [Bacteroides sp. 224]|uniref:hypothetical protein n=1 Tax=Bacteroides sp. 224 TaxID=2302936 RepID=UPI0013D4813E|nr:hypothetical protein [Bacteroides sp. 224]NDV63799.1 hypothetical protein [Bacteroides sp. 224]
MLKKAFVWLSRIRCRCGYGVHSPFAFDLITNVFYEKTPYYAYAHLKKQEEKVGKRGEPSLKVKRLLFRLVNRTQPSVIVDAGQPSNAAQYLKAAKKEVRYISILPGHELSLEKDLAVDFLYLHCSENPSFVEKAFEYCLNHTHQNTVFVIGDIYCSKQMKTLWEQFKEREEVGITFDLYNVGILFFDKTKIKQHYTVNF